VTDRGQTHDDSIYRASIASRGKNLLKACGLSASIGIVDNLTTAKALQTTD